MSKKAQNSRKSILVSAELFERIELLQAHFEAAYCAGRQDKVQPTELGFASGEAKITKAAMLTRALDELESKMQRSNRNYVPTTQRQES